MQGKYDAVKACVRGQMHDSSPLDFVSSLGTNFTTFMVKEKLGLSVYGVHAMSQAGAKLLDALFLPRFERERAEYWHTLRESSVSNPPPPLLVTNFHSYSLASSC